MPHIFLLKHHSSSTFSFFLVDFQESPFYELSVLIFIGATIFVNAYTVFHSVFFSISGTIGVHFDILIEELKSLKTSKTEFERKKLIKSVVRMHYELLDLCGRLNKIYAQVLMIQLYYAGMLIALEGLQFAKVNIWVGRGTKFEFCNF